MFSNAIISGSIEINLMKGDNPEKNFNLMYIHRLCLKGNGGIKCYMVTFPVQLNPVWKVVDRWQDPWLFSFFFLAFWLLEKITHMPLTARIVQAITKRNYDTKDAQKWWRRTAGKALSKNTISPPRPGVEVPRFSFAVLLQKMTTFKVQSWKVAPPMDLITRKRCESGMMLAPPGDEKSRGVVPGFLKQWNY